jgi:hypothetical protein
MLTTRTMPEAVAPKAAQVEKMHQPNRNPMPVLDKSNPLRKGPAARGSRHAGTTSPSLTQQSAARSVGAGFGVTQALVGLGFLVAVVLVALFGLDLACAWPLGRYAPVAEGVFFGSAVVLGYLSWDTYRELR